jgi:hypothetical protein
MSHPKTTPKKIDKMNVSVQRVQAKRAPKSLISTGSDIVPTATQAMIKVATAAVPAPCSKSILAIGYDAAGGPDITPPTIAAKMGARIPLDAPIKETMIFGVTNTSTKPISKKTAMKNGSDDRNVLAPIMSAFDVLSRLFVNDRTIMPMVRPMSMRL